MKQGKKLVGCFIAITTLLSSMTQIALANTPTAQNVNWQNGRPGMAIYDVTEDMQEYKFCLYKDGKMVYSTYGSSDGENETNYHEMITKMDNLGYGTYKFNIVTMDESGEVELAESPFSDEFVYQDLPDISEVTNVQFNGYTVTWDYPDDKADYFYVDIRKDKNNTGIKGNVIGTPCYEKTYTIPEYTIEWFEEQGEKLDELFVSIYALPKDRNSYNLSKSLYYSNKGGETTDIKVEIKNEGYDYKCGENATWSYNDGILTISGTGIVDDSSEIDDFYQKENFRLYGETYADGSTSVTEGELKIKAIVFEEGITQINETFRGPRTQCIVIPESMKKIEGVPFNPGVGHGLKTTYKHDGLNVIYNYSKDCEFSEKWRDTDLGIAIYTPEDSNLYKLLDNKNCIFTEGETVDFQKYEPVREREFAPNIYETTSDSIIPNAIHKSSSKNGSIRLETASHILIDINKTTKPYPTISDEIHRDAVVAAHGTNVIPNIYSKYGENITKEDLAIAMAQFWGYCGSVMSSDAFNKMFNSDNFTKCYEDTKLNTLTNNCIKAVDTWFPAKSETAYGVNENITYQDFMTGYINSIYDVIGFERPQDVMSAAKELGILNNMPTYSPDSYIRYEDVALALNNLSYPRMDNYILNYALHNTPYDKETAPTWEYIPMSANNYTKSIKLTIGSTAATVNGSSSTTDAAPKIVNSRTMLPIRFVAEALGAEVGWNGDTRTVTIIKGTTNIAITIDSDKAIVNGQEQILDAPAFVENSRTYLPVRFVSENLGAKVDWDGATQTVTIQAN